MTVILVAKDGKNLVPINVTTQQRLDYAAKFTIYDINPDGTKSAPIGPTDPAVAAKTVFGAASRSRTSAQLAAAPTAADLSLEGEFYLNTDPTQRYVINAAGTAFSTFGGGGAVASVNGQVGVVALTAGNVGAIGIPTPWAASAAGGSPLLTSGTATLGSSVQNTTPGYTTFLTPIDGIPGSQFNDIFECLTAGTWTLQPANVQSAAQIAAGATTGVVAQDASKNLYYVDGTQVSLGGTAIDLFGGNSMLLLPTGNNTTVWTGIGATATPAVVGTVTGRSGELASIGYVNRLAYVSAAAANSNALITTASAGLQSAAPNSSTFFPPQRARVVFSVTDALSACRMGAGFFSVTPTATVEPSTITNMAWFAADSTDTQLTFMTCAGSGTATKTTLNAGTGFPADTNGADVYECYIEFLGGATRKINYYIMNRATGVKASGQVTATLPAADTLLRIGAYRNTAANATACAIDVAAIAGGGFAQMGLLS